MRGRANSLHGAAACSGSLLPCAQPTLLAVEFSSAGLFGDDAATVYAELADDIAAEDGVIWKVGTEDLDTSIAGGVYLFTDKDSAASAGIRVLAGIGN